MESKTEKLTKEQLIKYMREFILEKVNQEDEGLKDLFTYEELKGFLKGKQ